MFTLTALIPSTGEMGLFCNGSKMEFGLWEMLSSLRVEFQAGRFKDEVMF